MVTISEVRAVSRDGRVALHSHIRGLGLTEEGIAENAAGFVGYATSEVALISVNEMLVKHAEL